MLRIVAGTWAGRRIEAPAGIRPSTERLREAVFSILQPHLAGCRFLDLCCGSGAMGLEAASRGAAFVLLADASRRSLAVARGNLEALGCGDARTRFCRVPRDLSRLGADTSRFDVVFADPPYEFDDFSGLLRGLTPLVTPGGIVVVEHRDDLELEPSGALMPEDRRVYGQSAVSFFRVQGSERSRNEVSSR